MRVVHHSEEISSGVATTWLQKDSAKAIHRSGAARGYSPTISTPQYPIFDRDAKFDPEVVAAASMLLHGYCTVNPKLGQQSPVCIGDSGIGVANSSVTGRMPFTQAQKEIPIQDF